ncbi:MOSC domain-containing protein [Chthonobacter rhizosphaerae]|uniref:MOSC domain-containing protein n=1 Tax=Chthonobacter rhizosphaerae TaxID=2735553 RepID=UPI0015EF3B0C|nr:MOSC domain-containing protein [Chthonobacter rhizosphaerae]
MPGTLAPMVIAVARAADHRFSKDLAGAIRLIAGEGVEGDAHRGVTVKHRSRVAQDPTAPNLRQVHLIQSELFDALAARGHRVRPGDLGENVTTRGVDLLALPVGTELRFAGGAVVELTGLRNPCAQIDAFQPGLLAEVVEKTVDGGLVRKAGVMGVVRVGGTIRTGDAIAVTLPPEPHRALDRV